MTIENCLEIDNNKIVIKGCVKSGCIRPGDKVYIIDIIDTYGKRISTTVEAVEMFGKCLDYAECGDNNIGILLGNNIVYDDIKVGHQIISDVSLNATEAESVIEDSYDDNALYNCGLSKTVKVTYNADTLQTEITVDGQPFDTSRINGKEIADWAYPFMMRKVKWNGFYDEMVEALGGDKEFNLIFEGSDEALAELKEAWEDAPVTIISKEKLENIVVIEYDEKTLTTNITVNGQPFDTSRINGKEIEDWIYPFMVRKVKWDGIFEELAKVVGSEDYTIQFLGSDTALSILSEETPENISISNKTCDIPIDTPISDEVKYIFDSIEKMLWGDSSYFDDKSDEETEEIIELLNQYADKGNHDAICYIAFMALASEDDDINNNDIIDTIIPIAEQGHAKTQYLLAMIYSGEFIENMENQVELLKWLRKSAEQGYAPAQYLLGLVYFDGDTLDMDLDKCVELFTLSAEQGYVDAQFSLGEYYNDIEIDGSKAYKWYIKAAEQGHANAMMRIGILFFHGDGVKQNYSESVKWLCKSIETDVELIMDVENITHLFDEKENYSDSLYIRKKLAELGEAISISNLGWHYQYGKGVEIDLDIAFSYYVEAAEMQNEWANEKLYEFLDDATNLISLLQTKQGLAYSKLTSTGNTKKEATRYYLILKYFAENGYKNTHKLLETYESEIYKQYKICFNEGVIPTTLPSTVNTPSKTLGNSFEKATDTLNKVVGFVESDTGQNILKVGRVIGKIGMALFQANQNRKASYTSSESYDYYTTDEDEY